VMMLRLQRERMAGAFVPSVREYFRFYGLDAEKLKAFSQDPVAKALFAIDINSRFEISPGIKDMKKVKQFCSNLG